MRIFADTADPDEIRRLNDRVDGFTTNPTLMRRAGATVAEVVEATAKPLSLEVGADEGQWECEAVKLSELAPNVLVKIPVTDCAGNSTKTLVNLLVAQGVRVNVTAVFDRSQVFGFPPVEIVSVFAGRIADTGRDPVPVVRAAKQFVSGRVLWASAREVFNVEQAHAAGADIITLSPELIDKRQTMYGRDLMALSLETVRQFAADAVA